MESYDLYSVSDTEFRGRRKDRKLLAEKRRRARINQCLTEIKDIVCGTKLKNDPNYEKMEKAEILETTVDYLRNVRKINTTPQQVKETIQVRFQQGFSRCAEEILTYIQSLPGMSDNVQHQLRKHLSGRLTHIQEGLTTSPTHHETSHMKQWHERLQPAPLQYPHPAAHAYLNLSVCTSPVTKDVSFTDSGYGGSPAPSEHKENCRRDNFSESELCNLDSRKSNVENVDSRVSAWVESTLPYSQQSKAGKQVLWRPW